MDKKVILKLIAVVLIITIILTIALVVLQIGAKEEKSKNIEIRCRRAGRRLCGNIWKE